jgi:ABC-type antimicrobial peptide transport system permease subunit
MRAVAVGLVAGILLGAGLASLAGSFLYGVSPLDPITIATVAILICVMGVVSIALPALKAARIEPATVLKG